MEEKLEKLLMEKGKEALEQQGWKGLNLDNYFPYVITDYLSPYLIVVYKERPTLKQEADKKLKECGVLE